MNTTTRHHSSDSQPHHQQVAKDAHGVLDRLSDSAVGEEAKELVAKLRDNLNSLKESAEAAQARLQEGVQATATRIEQNPWTSVGVAIAGGAIIGLLLGWRRNHRPEPSHRAHRR
jgi:ElaB/YqjD/DUF883 family membrane-anchored ribosome-binding protein